LGVIKSCPDDQLVWEVKRMLAVDFYRIHADQVARLREWMGEITARRNEALQTYAQEGVRHEMGYLLEDRHGPILVWVMEVHDRDEATRAFLNSKLPIDLQHQQVMRQVVAEWIKPQALYECLVSKV